MGPPRVFFLLRRAAVIVLPRGLYKRMRGRIMHAPYAVAAYCHVRSVRIIGVITASKVRGASYHVEHMALCAARGAEGAHHNSLADRPAQASPGLARSEVSQVRPQDKLCP